MEKTYEVRFGIAGKKKIQEYRVFTTEAASFSEAIKNFVEWANDGQDKFDMRKQPYRFAKYPVTEENAVSVCRLSW